MTFFFLFKLLLLFLWGKKNAPTVIIFFYDNNTTTDTWLEYLHKLPLTLFNRCVMTQLPCIHAILTLTYLYFLKIQLNVTQILISYTVNSKTRGANLELKLSLKIWHLNKNTGRNDTSVRKGAEFKLRLCSRSGRWAGPRGWEWAYLRDSARWRAGRPTGV